MSLKNNITTTCTIFFVGLTLLTSGIFSTTSEFIFPNAFGVVSEPKSNVVAQENKGTWLPIPLNRDCLKDDRDLSIFSLSDGFGNEIQITCNQGVYKMKFIDNDGNSTLVGKCPFPFGQNTVKVKLDYYPVQVNGQTQYNSKIVNTLWQTFDATHPAITSKFTDQKSIQWLFDARSGYVTQQKMWHDGQWVDNSYTVHLDNLRPYNSVTYSADNPNVSFIGSTSGICQSDLSVNDDGVSSNCPIRHVCSNDEIRVYGECVNPILELIESGCPGVIFLDDTLRPITGEPSYAPDGANDYHIYFDAEPLKMQWTKYTKFMSDEPIELPDGTVIVPFYPGSGLAPGECPPPKSLSPSSFSDVRE